MRHPEPPPPNHPALVHPQLGSIKLCEMPAVRDQVTQHPELRWKKEGAESKRARSNIAMKNRTFNIHRAANVVSFQARTRYQNTRGPKLEKVMKSIAVVVQGGEKMVNKIGQ